MSMSKLLITLGLILLMTLPFAVAQAEDSYSGSGTAVISDAGAMSDRVTFSMSGVSMLEAGISITRVGWSTAAPMTRSALVFLTVLYPAAASATLGLRRMVAICWKCMTWLSSLSNPYRTMTPLLRA